MPSLTKKRPRLSGPRTDVRWGLAGLCGILVLIAAVGIVYRTGTSSTHTYAADIADAGAVRAGDDVRIAGVPVGKVKSLSLRPDRVRMTFTVDDHVFLGDQTAVDIRMLTVVGGYYIAVQPAGTKPLGKLVIPRERVSTPYNLTQLFQDAVDPVRQIDGTTLQQSLTALASSLDKSPDSFHAAIQAAGSLVTVLDTQNADISHTLSMADEYLTALRANSHVVGQLLTAFGTLETIVQNDKIQVAQALNDTAVILHDLTPLGRAWDKELKPRARPLPDAVPGLEQLEARLGDLLTSIRTLEQRLTPYLPPTGGVNIDQSAATIQTSGVCVPIPGGSC